MFTELSLSADRDIRSASVASRDFKPQPAIINRKTSHGQQHRETEVSGANLAAFPLLGSSILSADWALAATPLSKAEMAQAKQRTTDQPLYWAWWGWEPWEHHRRAGGITGAVDGSSHWLHQWYDRLHTEELVELMAKVGVNMAITHFFKGFGLQHERAEQQRTAQLVRLAHKHGIRVIGYCQFRSLYYETFMLEEPSAENWIQRDPSGKPVPYYGKQYFRWMPCIHSQEFRDYTKRAVRVGIEGNGARRVQLRQLRQSSLLLPPLRTSFSRVDDQTLSRASRPVRHRHAGRSPSAARAERYSPDGGPAHAGMASAGDVRAWRTSSVRSLPTLAACVQRRS